MPMVQSRRRFLANAAISGAAGLGVVSAAEGGRTSLVGTGRKSNNREQCAHELTQRRIRPLPVVDSAGTLVGIVSRHDVLRWASRPAATPSPH